MRPEQVLSLTLSDESDETPNQSEFFCSLFSIQQFRRLRSLKLIKLDDNGESLVCDLCRLPHFKSLEIDMKYGVPIIQSPPLLERVIIHIPENIIFSSNHRLLQFDRDTRPPPYRYNHVQELDLCVPYRYEYILDLSQVQTLIVRTTHWSFFEMMTLIKEEMPLVNYLSLKLTYRDLLHQRLPDISLPQIRTLKLPVFGESEENHLFHWSKYFPRVERLTASFSSRKQIRFLIDHFQTMLNGSFHIYNYYIDPNERRKITYQWLRKHISSNRKYNEQFYLSNQRSICDYVFSIFMVW